MDSVGFIYFIIHMRRECRWFISSWINHFHLLEKKNNVLSLFRGGGGRFQHSFFFRWGIFKQMSFCKKEIPTEFLAERAPSKINRLDTPSPNGQAFFFFCVAIFKRSASIIFYDNFMGPRINFNLSVSKMEQCWNAKVDATNSISCSLCRFSRIRRRTLFSVMEQKSFFYPPHLLHELKLFIDCSLVQTFG